MNIYLDIDGTIITRDGKPAKGLSDFLKHVTEHHDVYWLTTHCREGDTSRVVEYLSKRLPQQLMQYVEMIKPTEWQTFKTEAINFTQDFIWLDDYMMEAEEKVLAKEDSLERVFKIDLRHDADSLIQALQWLQAMT